jgi:hypothetical protein
MMPKDTTPEEGLIQVSQVAWGILHNGATRLDCPIATMRPRDVLGSMIGPESH